MAAPDDWAGQQVKLQLEVARADMVQGVLEEVSDRGVVLRYNVRPEGERPIFYPWRLVGWIYPVEEPEGGADDDVLIGRGI
jgi:hypothetical protein